MSPQIPATGVQSLPESGPEVPVEVGIDEWVQGRVEVAHPEHRSDHWRRRRTRRTAERRDYVPGAQIRNLRTSEHFTQTIFKQESQNFPLICHNIAET